MTDTEKLELVCRLTERVKSHFAELLREKEIPKNWQGAEIRRWLADRFASYASGGMALSGKKLTSYLNDVRISSKL